MKSLNPMTNFLSSPISVLAFTCQNTTSDNTHYLQGYPQKIKIYLHQLIKNKQELMYFKFRL